MRYAKPKPSIVLATVAVVAVVSPFAVHLSGVSPSPVDNPSEVAETAIDQINLEDVPSTVLDLATSGLADAGIRLPEIDPADFNIPEIPLPGMNGSLGGPTTSSPTTPPTSSPSTSSPAESSPSTSPDADADGARSGEPEEPEGPETSSPATSEPTSPPAETQSPLSESAPAPGEPTPASSDADEQTTPDGRPVGALVKHLVRDTPFKMVAFTWDETTPIELLMRSKSEAGNWSEWTDMHSASGAGDTANDTPGGTEPVWVGDAREVQLAVADNGLAMPAAEGEGGVADIITGSATELLMSLASQALSGLSAAIINPQGLLDMGSSLLSPLAGGGPQVITRQTWGANESWRCSQPPESPDVRGAIVHHTAGNNDYSPTQSVEIVRGIYAYHAQTLGWCDIGYNVLVDKYGQIFEGAAGGLDRNVNGTHTGGFNKETVGVAMMGNLDLVAPTPQMVNSVGRFLKWRLGLARVNPFGTATLTAEGFSGSKYSAGAVTNLPAISGHRDYGNTSCPGVHGYAALDQIRSIAGGIGGGEGGEGGGSSDAPGEEVPPPGDVPPGDVPPGEVPPSEEQPDGVGSSDPPADEQAPGHAPVDPNLPPAPPE